jgi:hypothetical protein
MAKASAMVQTHSFAFRPSRHDAAYLLHDQPLAIIGCETGAAKPTCVVRSSPRPFTHGVKVRMPERNSCGIFASSSVTFWMPPSTYIISQPAACLSTDAASVSLTYPFSLVYRRLPHANPRTYIATRWLSCNSLNLPAYSPPPHAQGGDPTSLSLVSA